MAKVRDICRHVRSKNAGPFWVTIDLFFTDADTFDKYAMSPALGPQLLKSLNVVKISYPRPQPQGWMGERDMHQGQSFARLLEIEVG